MSERASALILALESGVDRVKSLAATTGMKVESMHARLHELKRLGVVSAVRVGHRRTSCGHWHGEREKRYYLTNKATT